MPPDRDPALEVGRRLLDEPFLAIGYGEDEMGGPQQVQLLALLPRAVDRGSGVHPDLRPELLPHEEQGLRVVDHDRLRKGPR